MTAVGERGLDGIVHSAATGIHRPIEQLSDRHFDFTFAVNVKALLGLVQQLLPVLARGSAIVALSSEGAARAVPSSHLLGRPEGLWNHCARHLAVELAPRGIRVDVLSPGAVRTPAWDALPGPRLASRGGDPPIPDRAADDSGGRGVGGALPLQRGRTRGQWTGFDRRRRDECLGVSGQGVWRSRRIVWRPGAWRLRLPAFAGRLDASPKRSPRRKSCSANATICRRRGLPGRPGSRDARDTRGVVGGSASCEPTTPRKMLGVPPAEARIVG